MFIFIYFLFTVSLFLLLLPFTVLLENELLLLEAGSCNSNMTVHSIAFFALGTINSIRVFCEEDEAIVWKAVERVKEIEKRMSAFLPSSDLSLIREKAGGGFQPIHDDTFRLLEKAVKFGRQTQGAFDITINPLVQLWGINKKGDFVPSEAEIQESLALVDYRSVHLDHQSTSCSLAKKGQSIDLGGIAKGFAADEVRKILIENGVQSALIDLGGNIATVGNHPDGGSWKIGIQNPLAPRGEYAACLSVSDRTIVTSGSNERFFMKDGIRYHHIIDPRTGKPAQSSVLSVTAIGNNSVYADALTTAFFILGPEKSFPLIRQFHVEAVFIMKDLSVVVSRGLKESITFQGGVCLHETA